MILDLLDQMNAYKIAVYRASDTVLDTEFQKILSQFSEMIDVLFSSHDEIINTKIELLKKAYLIMERNDYLLRCDFLEMELEPIIEEIKSIESELKG